MRLSTSLEAAKARLLAELQALPPSSAAPPSHVCQTCGGRGFVRYDVPLEDPRWGKLWPCPAPDCSARAEQQAQRAPYLLRKSGLPDKYTRFTFASWLALPDDLRQGKQKAARAAWAWAQGPVVIGDARPWLVLHGPLGVGKTGLAAAAVNHLVSQGQPIVFYRLAELFSDIQGRYGKDDGPSADDVLQAIQRAPRLVLDEANIPAASADKQRIFEEIVRYRHGRDLPTMLTCNVDPQGFATMWGERTADVVFEAAHWITLGGPKLRKGLK